jgi:tRNA A-37 threonylcarbamoyl transferase component Bud32/tetratricopeptide (TPR) repeat protein
LDRIGRYEVIRELGRGGMGRVFHARDPELERSVALKLLHRDTAGRSDARVQFRDEARALAALSHPGIVTVFEIGEHDGLQFIAMEYLPGQTLRDLLQYPEHRRTRAQLVEICRQVVTAVGAAHSAGILHRDIKPENVVVGERGAVKVVDFGIARRLDAEAVAQIAAAGAAAPSTSRTELLVDAFTRTIRTFSDSSDTQVTAVTAATQTIFGTPAYMAPEVLAGEPSTVASDIYSLGVLVYECLAGRRPYEAPTLYEVIALVIDGSEPVVPLADPLGPLVTRMLAREPAERPPVDAILAALAETPRPLEGSPPPRRPHAAWLGLAALALAAAGVAAWQLVGRQPPMSHAPGLATVAVQDLTLRLPSYGAGAASGTAHADVLALLLADVPGARTIRPGQLTAETARPTEWEPTARRLEATHLVRGEIAETDGQIEARLEILDLAHDRRVPVRGTVARTEELPRLLHELSEQIARSLGLVPRPASGPDRARARVFHEIGAEALLRRHWYVSRAYLEQAAELDPSFFDAWQGVASARSWTMAPPALLEDAVSRALALAPDGPMRAILQGASHYFRGDFGRAIAALAPLEAEGAALGADDRRELRYYLAESYWHDGEHDRAIELFTRILDGSLRFKHASIHAGQYALARRDVTTASLMIGIQESGQAAVDFAAGKYDALAEDPDRFPESLYARLVLDRPPAELADRLRGTHRHVHRIARAAAAGDRGGARAEFAALWEQVAAGPATEAVLYELESLGEVLVAAELGDELRRFLAFHAGSTAPRALRSLHRFTVLGAPLLGTPSAFDTSSMIGRTARLATAIEAELAGDRARAAELLAALVADPTFTWDYPERVALARNLAALGQRDALAALCADTLRPAVYREAFLLARSTCRRLTRR